MYEIWYSNFHYLDHNAFETLDEAIAHGRSKGFEFEVYFDNDLVGYAEGVSLTWYDIT